MTREEARAALQQAAAAINLATTMLRPSMDLFAQFDKELRDIEDFGHIVDPTLYRDPERRAVAALLGPCFKQAAALVKTFDEQMARGEAALKQVTR